MGCWSKSVSKEIMFRLVVPSEHGERILKGSFHNLLWLLARLQHLAVIAYQKLLLCIAGRIEETWEGLIICKMHRLKNPSSSGRWATFPD